ncbi:MAG: Serine/threonine-protein kinase PknD [Phycisphaerales bacterium]|nr:Serine/threonine-protein kinase PknD [Phycisphaerales bacterium]
MNTDLVKELFAGALALPRDQRADFVAQSCRGDDRLRREVESLLAAHDTSETFLESGALCDAGLAPPVHHWPAPGATLGQFVLESVIGSGGMGVVFRARQESPPRPVAIKIMRAASVGGVIDKRFTREAAVLARLQHPCIAQIFAAGVETTPTGPLRYLAMELVEGRPLDAYVREHSPSAADRAELMARICEGVAHAHQRGVVHRDLKPGNILIDASGNPKILDFGIARLIDVEGGDPTPHTSHTQRGEILGTLAYMSPEQFEADPDRIDVRSDVYALGSILYEVLTGKPAIPTDRLSIAQAAVAVSTRDPVPMGAVDPRLRGDLEIITSKALEKDPDRRYQSAAELAEDLRRHLRDEPILARPATAVYRTRKFVRRHRSIVLLTLGVICALIAGMITTAWQAARADRQRDLAQAEVHATNEINEFLGEILLASEPEKARGKPVTIRMALDQATRKLDEGAISNPRVLASIHGTMGRAYWALGEMALAEPHSRASLELKRDVLGPEAIETFNAAADLSILLHDMGRDEEARSVAAEALESCRRAISPEQEVHARLMNALANASPSTEETKKLYIDTVDLYTRLRGPEDHLTLLSLNNLAVWYLAQQDYAEGERICKQVLEARSRTLGEDHPDTIVSYKNLAGAYRLQGRLEEALPLIQKSAELGDRVRGPANPNQIATKVELALCLGLLNRIPESEAVLRGLLPLSLNPDGSVTEQTPMVHGMLGEVLILAGKLDEAEQCAANAVRTATEFYGDPSHQEVKRAMSVYVSVYEAKQQWASLREWNEKLRGSTWFQAKYALKPGDDPGAPPAADPPAQGKNDAGPDAP